MSTLAKMWIVCALFVSMPVFSSGHEIQFKSGEMGFLNFLEMVSEKLDLQIDASTLGSSRGIIVIPDAGPLTLDRAKALVLSALYLRGYTWIHDSATDLYRIIIFERLEIKKRQSSLMRHSYLKTISW